MIGGNCNGFKLFNSVSLTTIKNLCIRIRFGMIERMDGLFFLGLKTGNNNKMALTKYLLAF